MTRHVPVVFFCLLSLGLICCAVQILLTILDSNPYLSDGSRQVCLAAFAVGSAQSPRTPKCF